MPEIMPVTDAPLAMPTPRKKILVVDDEPFIVEMLTELFEDRYDVIQAGNGLEALGQFERNHHYIIAVVSDLIMPRMNGRDLIHRLRAKSSNLTIVAISGSPADETELAELRVQLLKKPFKLGDLERALRGANE